MRPALPKVISFDMDGTLTQNHFAELVWREGIPSLYSVKRGVSLQEAKERVFREYDGVGENRLEWYDIKFWFGVLGLGPGWESLLRRFEPAIRPFSEVLSALGRLNKEYRLAVISNAAREFIDIELKAAGLAGYFEATFSCTSDFGEVKKTPGVYLKVCHALDIEPGEMVHVGDHPVFDFTVPHEAGISAFYLDRQGNAVGDSVVRNLAEFCQIVSAL